jgi:lysophospholipase L1-like esterase
MPFAQFLALRHLVFAFYVVGVSIALLAAVELVAGYHFNPRGFWWQLITERDPELGFTLRPSYRTGPEFIRNYTHNLDGIRSRDTDSRVAARREGETLILVVGDSNAYGNTVVYEDTYAAQLERLLKDDSPNSSVRVVNLGVPGYSSFQARTRLERWMKLDPGYVIFADSFNDRTVNGGADSAQAFREAPRYVRPWEVGPFRLRSMLLLGRPKPAPAPDLMLPLGEPRVSEVMTTQIYESVVDLTRRHGAGLIFLATGDKPRLELMSERGLALIRDQRWGAAEAFFAKYVAFEPRFLLGWKNYYRSHVESGGDGVAILQAYDEKMPSPLTYLSSFVRYSGQGIDRIREVAQRRDVELIDMREDFRAADIEFADVCHFRAEGHKLVALRIAEALRGKGRIGRIDGVLRTSDK